MKDHRFIELLQKARDDGVLPLRPKGFQSRDVLKYLEEGGDPNASTVDGLCLLHLLADDSADGELISLVVTRGAKIDARDRFGQTPLHLAVDADCDSSSRDGCRPSQLPTTKTLIELGADEMACAINGNTPRDFAAAYGRHELQLYDAISRLKKDSKVI